MTDTHLRPGVYRHYRGGFYEVLGVAERVDRHESLVVYRRADGDGSLFTRPLADFTAAVTDGRATTRRFVFLGDTAPSPG